MLRYKNKGPCRELRGNIKLMFVFVSTPEHPISVGERKEFLGRVGNNTRDFLLNEGKRHHVDLDVSSWYYEHTIPFEYDKEKKEWLWHVLQKKFHRDTIYSVQKFYVQNYGFDSTPFIFVFGGRGGWFSYIGSTVDSENEHCICFIQTNTGRKTCAHELLHLYGAVNLDENESIKKAAKVEAPRSVMFDRNGTMIDSATAYLIGWRKELSPFGKTIYDLYSMWQPTPPTPTSGGTGSATTDLSEPKKKYVAVRKNFGPCREFVGKIRAMIVFVSTPGAVWTKREIDSYCKEMDIATKKINEQASKRLSFWNTPELQYSYFCCQTVYEFEDKKEKWLGDVMDHYFHSGSITELQDYYGGKLKADSTPFLFLFNISGRSYARPSRTDCNNALNEYAVCFAKDTDRAYTAIHELMHLYGAVDLYYPEEVKTAALKYMPNSVMLRRNSFEVDDLTAYLIGWNVYRPTIVKIFADILEKYKGQS